MGDFAHLWGLTQKQLTGRQCGMVTERGRRSTPHFQRCPLRFHDDEQHRRPLNRVHPENEL
jgi:hypothetical protein